MDAEQTDDTTSTSFHLRGVIQTLTRIADEIDAGVTTPREGTAMIVLCPEGCHWTVSIVMLCDRNEPHERH